MLRRQGFQAIIREESLYGYSHLTPERTVVIEDSYALVFWHELWSALIDYSGNEIQN